MHNRILLFIFFFLGFDLNAQTVLFQDDFGTFFQAISSTNWPCKSSSPSYNSSSGTCASSVDYGVYLYSSQYLTSKGISLPTGATITLTFEYSFGASYSSPSVQIGTGTSCALATFTTLQTLSQTTGCQSVTIDISSYAGQTVYIKFQAGWSSLQYFYLDNVKVTSSAGGGGTCGTCIGLCLNSTQNGNWTNCNTWEGGANCGWWGSFAMSNRSVIINNNVTVSGIIPNNLKNCQSIYIRSGGTLTFSTSYPGNSSGSYVIDVCGTLNIDAGTMNFDRFELLVHSGGVVNINAGTLTVNNIVVESGGVINLNGGTLERTCGTWSSQGLIVQEGGLINVNSSLAKLSVYSCFGTPYTLLDGTIDCKNSLSFSNYTNIKLGNVRVTNNTSTGRIRTQTAYIPMAEWNRSAANNFWGFNSGYGGTVEYYGNSSIFLGLSSRYEYYDLELNTNVYLYRETDVVGMLYLKGGNLKINGKRLVLHGSVSYTSPYTIDGGGTLEIVGKLSGLKDAGLTTYLISTQGNNNVNVRNMPLRFGSSQLDTLRLFREDVVMLQTPVRITGQLQLDRGILHTDATNYPAIENPASDAVRHKTKGYQSLYGFISGYLFRRVGVGNSYDFPVGYPNMTEYNQGWDVTRPLPLHRLFNLTMNSKNLNPGNSSGILVNFVPSIGTCTGTLTNAVETTGETYTQLHPEGKWQVVLTPAEPGETFDYDVKLYTWGFDTPALTDNRYAPLKRPDGSVSCADWTTGGGNLGTPNQLGRIILVNSVGMDTSYALRTGLSDFSEFAIGIMDVPLTNLYLKALPVSQNIYRISLLSDIEGGQVPVLQVFSLKDKRLITEKSLETYRELTLTEDVKIRAILGNTASEWIYLKYQPDTQFHWYFSNNELVLRTPEAGTLQITDLTGREILRRNISAGETRLPILQHRRGIFLLRFNSGHITRTDKIIK